MILNKRNLWIFLIDCNSMLLRIVDSLGSRIAPTMFVVDNLWRYSPLGPRFYRSEWRCVCSRESKRDEWARTARKLGNGNASRKSRCTGGRRPCRGRRYKTYKGNRRRCRNPDAQTATRPSPAVPCPPTRTPPPTTSRWRGSSPKGRMLLRDLSLRCPGRMIRPRTWFSRISPHRKNERKPKRGISAAYRVGAFTRSSSETFSS